MATALALILPTVILVAWALERRERANDRTELLAAHQRERDAWQTECRDLRAANEREREQWVNERTMLLNRIKPDAPQPILHGPVLAPPAVPVESDEAYWESKEELAERLARLESGAVA
jgi:hypothetical protein